MAAIKISISVPDELLVEIDNIAESWWTTRSGAFVRIYQEWKRARETQAEETEAKAEVVEAV